MDIILASTSPYRRRLLDRLQVSFRAIAPQTDETPLPGEGPATLALRLARSKANSIAILHPDALVIGSDQVAAISGDIIGKPGSLEAATEQLRRSSGREIEFHTAVAIASLQRNLERFHVELTTVRFRTLDDNQIAHYLNREQPYDCAGSFKVESLGIALFEGVTGSDPTALEGLPLIKLTGLLAAAGLDILRPLDIA